MNFPLEIGIGNFKVTAHLIFETLAFVIGFRYYLFLRKHTQDEITEPRRIWIIIGAAFGAFLFSRLIGALENPIAWGSAAYPWLYFFQNKTIVGGLLGGLIGVELMKHWIGEKRSSGDLFTPPLILAMMIGRIGCFTSGVYEQTYGIESTLPWAMNLGDGLLRHPVALYEIVFLALLGLGLHLLKSKYTFQNGVIFKLFLISYLVFRFMLEWIKPGLRFEIGLTAIQITCMLGLLYYGKTIFYGIFKPSKLLTHE